MTRADLGRIARRRERRRLVRQAERSEQRPRNRGIGDDGDHTAASTARALKHVAKPWTKHGPTKGKYKPTGDRVLYLPGFHTLRRTFLSVAHECGVTKLDQHLLSNHAFGGRDVHDDYVRQAFPHLRQLVDKIDAALWARLRPVANNDDAHTNERASRPA